MNFPHLCILEIVIGSVQIHSLMMDQFGPKHVAFFVY